MEYYAGSNVMQSPSMMSTYMIDTNINYDLFSMIKSLNILEDVQITELLNLKYMYNMKNLITSEPIDLPYVYQYIGLLYIYDWNKLYNESIILLKNTIIVNFKEFLFGLSIFNLARQHQQMEIENIENKIEVTDGAYICPKCSSSKTLSSAAQRASSDEASTIYLVCIACGHGWHIRG
uniref:Transcription factor S-II n=1 Tax=Pithovirus LCPAC102 TaxID=2506587 RepID=A0A4D5XF66_9VIRU|nr:MAG: transcription factor S-II [Pithovirus LCPAC102]